MSRTDLKDRAEALADHIYRLRDAVAALEDSLDEAIDLAEDGSISSWRDFTAAIDSSAVLDAEGAAADIKDSTE